jgi:hypothetical protein
MTGVTDLHMVEPVVNLELNPCRGQHVQRGGRNEAPITTSHKLVADHARVRGPKLLLGGLCRQVPREISAESHSSAAHEGLFEGVELPVGVAGPSVSLIRQWRVLCVSLGFRGGIAIVQVVLPQLDSQEGEVEGANEPGELVPRDHLVQELEGTDADALEKVRIERRNQLLIMVRLLFRAVGCMSAVRGSVRRGHRN